MIKIVAYGENFWDLYESDVRDVVAYGAGRGLKEFFYELPELRAIYDKKANEIKMVYEQLVTHPEEMKKIKEPIYVIVCVYEKAIFEEICEEISMYVDNAVIVHLFDNIGFGSNYWATSKSYFVKKQSEKLRVNIVCQEGAWIFKKFADRMQEVLLNNGVEVMVSPDTRADVDINHHIPYDSFKPYPHDTIMITHVDTMKKIHLLKKQLQNAGMGICMSKDTMNKLVSYGIPRDKLCYINPAQDNVIKPHKYVIGITHKCHDSEDLRKRATAILDVLEGVNPDYFCFIIMGAGWDEIVDQMETRGFETEYYPEFVYDVYNELMQKIDYFLYMGFDEGTMGYLDALAAGAGTIVTPQGYHLDTDCAIDYPCSTIAQFREAFLDLQKKREKRINAVKEWTWKNYTDKHMEIWNYLLHRVELKELYNKQSFYEDGIYSAMIEDNRV